MTTRRAWLASGLAAWCWPALAPAQPGAAVRDAIGQQIANQVAAGQRWSAESRMVTPLLQIGDTQRQLIGLWLPAGGQQLLQQFADGTLLVWDLARGAPVASLLLGDGDRPLVFDTESRMLQLLRDGRLLLLPPTGGAQPLAAAPAALLTAVADGPQFWAGTREGQVLLLAGNGTLRRQVPTSPSAIRSLAPVGGQAVLALDDAGDAWLVEAARTQRLAGGIASLGGRLGDGRHLLLLRDGSVRSVDAQGQLRALDPPPAEHGAIRQLAASPDDDAVAAVTERGALWLWQAGGWQVIDARTAAVVCLGRGRFLHARPDGVAMLRRAGVGHALLSIVPAASGWVVVDHEGRYDGSVDGTKDVHWQAGNDSLPLDRFFDDYFHTGLLAQHIAAAGSPPWPGPPARVSERVFLPPEVAIDLPAGPMTPGQATRVVVVSESRGGDLREDTRLFHNGKRLPPKARVGSQRVEKDGRLLLADVFELQAERGANELFAEARNVHGLAGRSAVVRQVTPGFQAAGRLQLVGVAIDRYRVPAMNLDYAKADVQALVQATERAAGGTYAAVGRSLLTDEQATRRGVLDLLQSLQRLQPQDVLLLVLAGHGTLERDEWFFLPHDVDPSDVRRQGLSARELQDALVAAPARQIFVMIDACNAGATVDSFNRYRDFQRRFAQQVGRSAGISVLTATRRDQQAVELRSLGHGLFSHVALQGLAGQADRQPQDGTITAHELAAFVGERLEARSGELAARSLAGQPAPSLQSPAYFVIGADFPIGTVRR